MHVAYAETGEARPQRPLRHHAEGPVATLRPAQPAATQTMSDAGRPAGQRPRRRPLTHRHHVNMRSAPAAPPVQPAQVLEWSAPGPATAARQQPHQDRRTRAPWCSPMYLHLWSIGLDFCAWSINSTPVPTAPFGWNFRTAPAAGAQCGEHALSSTTMLVRTSHLPHSARSAETSAFA